MSMYDLALGDGNQGARLHLAAAMLGMSNLREFGRPRDAWFEEGDVIAVYTRNGGGNRPDYESEIKTMQAHPLYVEDADDDFDNTYATFRFRMPTEAPTYDAFTLAMMQFQTTWEEFARRVRQIQVPRRDMSKVWLETIDALKEETP